MNNSGSKRTFFLSDGVQSLLGLLPSQPVVSLARHKDGKHAKGALHFFGVDLLVIPILVVLSLVRQALHIGLEKVPFLHLFWHSQHVLSLNFRRFKSFPRANDL